MTAIVDIVARMKREGTAYQGAMADLTELVRWAESRLTAESGQTHWEDCWRIHKDCAIRAAEKWRSACENAEAARGITIRSVKHQIETMVDLVRQLTPKEGE
jgi:hypothetical protein